MKLGWKETVELIGGMALIQGLLWIMGWLSRLNNNN